MDEEILPIKQERKLTISDMNREYKLYRGEISSTRA